MNGNRFLLDTNIILYILGGNKILADYLFEKNLYTSVICEIELLSFKLISTKQEGQIHNFLKEFKIISIDQSIKDTAIKLKKQYNIKIPDAIIASTAINLEMPLVTGDKDFKLIDELQIDFYNN